MAGTDRFGHCVKCHKKMMIEAVIGGKIHRRFLPDYTNTLFLLDDGSRMKVAICKGCKNGLKPEDYPYVMDCVLNGWKEEVKGLRHWSKERKENYIDKYSKREIVTNADNKPQDRLAEDLANFKKEKKNVPNSKE